jgi:hypothetical protein
MKTLDSMDKKLCIIVVLLCLVEISYYFWVTTYPPETPISCEFVVHSAINWRNFTFIQTVGEGRIRLDGVYDFEVGARYRVEGIQMDIRGVGISRCIRPENITRIQSFYLGEKTHD